MQGAGLCKSKDKMAWCLGFGLSYNQVLSYQAKAWRGSILQPKVWCFGAVGGCGAGLSYIQALAWCLAWC